MDSKVQPLLLRAHSLCAKFQQGSEARCIDEAIALDREALDICTSSHPQRSVCLIQLSVHIWTRYNHLGGTEHLNEAILLTQEAVTLCPPGNPDRSPSLNNLALFLCIRYTQLGGVEDLDKAIVLDRDVLALRPPGHPDRSMSLSNLALHLCTRYNDFGGAENLNEAIVLDREALILRPLGHPDRATSLNNLALHLCTRYNQFGGVEDLEEAIVLDRDALLLCPPGHLLRSTSLSNLAIHLWTQYRRLGRVEDLHESIVLGRDVLALHPPGHPNRPMSFSNLAGCIYTRYMQLGGVRDLNEVISLDREALALRQPGHPDRSISLNNLALHLCGRYKQLGGVEDLDEAILLSRDTLVLRPPGHPLRSTSLNNLAAHIHTRYEQLGSAQDLNEAITLCRDALALCPSGHPEWSSTSSNLTGYIFTRYKQLGRVEDIEEAISLDRDVLTVCPPGHPDRAASLSNLAAHLSVQYNRRGGVENLDEAVLLAREALALHPQGHLERSKSLNNLASHLSFRYDQLGGVEDLEEAILIDQDALALRPPGHPDWSLSLKNLAADLSTRYKQLGKVGDREEIFCLYNELARGPPTVSSNDLSAAKAWVNAAENFFHPTTILAYETALQMLVHHFAALPSLPQHLTNLKALSSSLAVDAFSACLRNQSPTNAIALLEQGRGVFWSQLSRLRSPLDDVVASGPGGELLADEFKRLTMLIRNALDSPDPDQHDRVCHLNSELQKTVTKIRKLPGLSRFLLPSLFSDLQRAASGGPVIIVNASKYSCDALVVFAERDPVHIPLTVTKEDVRDLSSKFRGLTVLAKRSDVTRDLSLFLRELWDQVVSPIANFLRTTYPLQSRIWWCPTAEFSLLPLHAAAPYRKGQQSLAGLYVSSYTPTLSALIRARQNHPSNLAMEQKRFLGIGQAKASGANELLSVGAELTNIGQCIDGPATFTCIEGQESCISRVTEELSKNEWVHLACHGLPNRKQPFDSAFALYDGHFTIQRIIQCNLQNSEFAYLSACHTTVGDEESPDEVIHLASAMQFAGFRSVIGTMWAVDDAETNKITSVFYTHMMDESGHLDHTRAAYALWRTMKLVKIPLDQRILYIHLGA